MAGAKCTPIAQIGAMTEAMALVENSCMVARPEAFISVGYLHIGQVETPLVTLRSEPLSYTGRCAGAGSGVKSPDGAKTRMVPPIETAGLAVCLTTWPLKSLIIQPPARTGTWMSAPICVSTTVATVAATLTSPCDESAAI